MTTVATSVVSIRRDGGVCVITIDNPPVNALSSAVRTELQSALRRVEQDEEVTAVILTAAGKSFVAGADIREFDAPQTRPTISEVVETVDQLNKPVIAVVKGNTMGGGLELALAADYRFIDPDAKLAFPEVLIGLIPGAGGTQRLPRLVGIPRAIEIITSGRTIGAAEAVELGFGDEPMGEDTLSAAINMARRRPPKRQISKMAVRAKGGSAKERSLPEVAAAIACIEMSSRTPFKEALGHEAETFESLKGSSRSQALRYLFFAERKASRLQAKVEAVPIASVAIIGGGTMGAGIAVAAAAAGLRTVLIERDRAGVASARGRVEAFSARVARGNKSADLLRTISQNMSVSDCWAAVSQADIVIEAVFEDLDLKKSVIRRCAESASRKAIIASNTSYLDLDEIASGSGRAQDVIGLHFFNPAFAMPLLEVVRTSHSNEVAVATGLLLGKRLGKTCVVAGAAEGFIGNRLFSRYRRHCELLVAHGASPYAIDSALEGFGFSMGPFATSDLTGLDISWSIRKRSAKEGSGSKSIADRLCEIGRFGRKTNRGWYLYEHGHRRPDAEVLELVNECRVSDCFCQGFSPTVIVDQVMAILANEGANAVAAQVARSGSDVDVTFVNGYGISRGVGGPMFHADKIGLGRTAEILSEIGRKLDSSLVVAPLLATCADRQLLLRECAAPSGR